MNIKKFREYFEDYSDLSDEELVKMYHQNHHKGLDWTIFKEVFLDPVEKEVTKEVMVPSDNSELVKAIQDMTKELRNTIKGLITVNERHGKEMMAMMQMMGTKAPIQVKAPDVHMSMPEEKAPPDYNFEFTYDDEGKITGAKARTN